MAWQWNPQQDHALKQVISWAKDKKAARQVFRLFGFAGTGKTTLALEIANAVGGLVLFVAYTGKAALVLRKKGCEASSTIHSLIYRAEDGEDGGMVFKLNRSSAIRDAKLVIVDEGSMVDEDIGRDLLSFGKKVDKQGLMIPGIVLTLKTAPTSIAPELPALAKESNLPSLSNLKPMDILEFGF